LEILLLEDHRFVADAMQVLLKQVGPNINVTACYSTQHAFSLFDENAQFDLILTDLLMPGIDGIGFLVGLRNRDVKAPVVIISGVSDQSVVRNAYDNGAAGFFSKSLPTVELVSGLRQVMAGQRYFPDLGDMNNQSHIAGSGAGARFITTNTGRRPGEKQLQVLRLMAEGNSNKQISQIVGISEATVKYHTSQLFKLLSVKNRTSCVREAQSRGLLDGYQSAMG